jgi:hypothetical protein
MYELAPNIPNKRKKNSKHAISKIMKLRFLEDLTNSTKLSVRQTPSISVQKSIVTVAKDSDVIIG